MKTTLLALSLVFAFLLAPPAFGEAVDAATCGACHDDVVAAFARGPHGAAMARRSPAVFSSSCVACHGDGKAHVDDPKKENISRAPAARACLSCHAASGTTPLTTPAHARGQVGCLSCHASGHTAPAAPPLLRARPHDLCGSCHESQKSASKLPYAHRDGSRPFDCTNCHGIHGKTRPGRLNLLGNGGACLDCHSEKGGPWVFPHAPREVNSCVACHQPHGSTNPRLLARRSIQPLCLECHTNLPTSHDQTKNRYRNCLSCHRAVHGSNHEPKLFEE